MLLISCCTNSSLYKGDKVNLLVSFIVVYQCTDNVPEFGNILMQSPGKSVCFVNYILFTYQGF